MADASNSPPWGKDWLEANQRYWADAADRWWKQMTPPAPPSSRELFDRLVEQGKTFLRFSEELTASTTQAGGAFHSQDEWQRALRSIAETWQAGFGQPAGDPGLAAFWKLPFDTWSRTASGRT